MVVFRMGMVPSFLILIILALVHCAIRSIRVTKRARCIQNVEIRLTELISGTTEVRLIATMKNN